MAGWRVGRKSTRKAECIQAAKPKIMTELIQRGDSARMKRWVTNKMTR